MIMALMLGQLITAMDVALVNVALPTIGKDLNISITAAGWLMAIFFLITTSFMIALGRLGDLVGHKRIFICGLALFLVSSLAGALCPNYGSLLVVRALQGVAAAMISANFSALIIAAFPSDSRGKALGLAATSIFLGFAVGPLLGGVISGTLGWRYIFLVTPALAFVSIVVCYRYVPESQIAREESIDLGGSFLILACLAPATLALTRALVWGWASPVTIGLLTTSCAAAWLFFRHERKTSFPVMELKLFSDSNFTLSNLAYFTSFVCLEVMLFSTPFFLQYFLQMSPQGIGLVISFTNAVPLLLLMPSGIWSDRVGVTSLEISGMALICFSLGLLALAGSSLTLFLVMISAAILGLGYGIFCSPNWSAIMGSVPESRWGVAGGVYGTMRNIGALTGIAMAGSVMGQWATKKPTLNAAGGAFTNPAFQAAVRHAYLAGFMVGLAGILILCMKLRHRHKPYLYHV